MTIALAIPPLTVKYKGDALIRDRALNRVNTVIGKSFKGEMLTLPMLRLLRPKHKDANIIEKQLNPVILLFIGYWQHKG